MVAWKSEYASLDPSIDGQFRLLHLHACKDWPFNEASHDITVTGHLEIVDPRQDPKTSYEIISYVWGDATERESILLDQVFVDVPRNTCHALRAISLGGGERIVWIDAVCINQKDTDERTAQVRQMSSIYRNGQHNLLYMGNGGEFLYRSLFNMALLANFARSGVTRLPIVYSCHAARALPTKVSVYRWTPRHWMLCLAKWSSGELKRHTK